MLINFEIWQRQFLDGESLPSQQLDVAETVAV
jgi:hypothetical protein